MTFDPSKASCIASTSDLSMFLEAMDGEWRVTHYELDEDDRLRVHYQSQLMPHVRWSHKPFNALDTIPKVGTVGRIGFIHGSGLPMPKERKGE